MSHTAEAQPAGHPGGAPYGYDDAPWSGRHFGAPLPIKILGVVVAFLIFKPLGVAALVYLIWRSARRNGGCGFRRREGFGHGVDAAPGPPAGRAPQRETPHTKNISARR